MDTFPIRGIASLLSIVCLYFLPASTPLCAQEIDQEDSTSFLEFELGDAEVNLRLNGFWMGSLGVNLGLALAPELLSWQAPISPLLFAQEVDLDLLLEVDRRWFLAVSFSDSENISAYSMGYRGDSNDFLKTVVLGNAGLAFPAIPFSTIGGDIPSSIGIWGHFGSSSANIHSLLRYDSVQQQEKYWRGGAELERTDVAPQNIQRPQVFILPEKNLPENTEVWLEDSSSGDIVLPGPEGGKFRRAGSLEYKLSRELGILELNKLPSARVLIYWAGMGEYDYNSDPFLQETRQAFNQASENKLDIASLPLLSRLSIEGKMAMVLYSPGLFSPYAVQNNYRAPSGTNRAWVVDHTNGLIDEAFILLEHEDSIANTWSLRQNLARNNPRSVYERFPLLEKAWYIYIPQLSQQEPDISLRFESLTGTEELYIGSDAVAQTVQLWRNGVLDPLAQYRAEEGIISPSTPIREDESVKATWVKAGDQTDFGNLSMGLGFIYANPESPFNWGSAIFFRWPLLGNTWSEYGSTYPGETGISAWLDWNKDDEKSRTKAGAQFGIKYIEEDSSNLYRLEGFENSNYRLYPASYRAKIPGESGEPSLNWLKEATRQPLKYRDYSKVDISGQYLGGFSSTSSPVHTKEGPYPVMDSHFSSAALVAEFLLPEEQSWAGYQLDIGELEDVLSNGERIDIPYYFKDLSGASNFELIIQIGCLSQPEDHLAESPTQFITRIYTLEEIKTTSPRILSIHIDQDEKKNLSNARTIRFLFHKTDSNSEETEGLFVLGPIDINGSLWSSWHQGLNGQAFPAALDGREWFKNERLYSHYDSSLAAKYPEKIERVSHSLSVNQVLFWENIAVFPFERHAILRRFPAIPKDKYKYLSFFIKRVKIDGSAEGIDLELTLAQSIKNTLSGSGQAALYCALPLSSLEEGAWQFIRISLDSGTVEIDGVDQGKMTFYTDRRIDDEEGINLSISLSGPKESGAISLHSLVIDEISLEESTAKLLGLSGLYWNHNRPGAMLQRGEQLIVSDFMANTTINSSIPFDNIFESRFMGSGDFQISLLQCNLQAGGNASIDSLGPNYELYHRIGTNLGAFSAFEYFTSSPINKNSLSMRNVSLSSPIYVALDLKTERDSWLLAQNWGLSLMAGEQKKPDSQNPGHISSFIRLQFATNWESEAKAYSWLEGNWIREYGQSYVDLLPIEGGLSRLRLFDAGMSTGLQFNRLALILENDWQSAYSWGRGSLNQAAHFNISLPFYLFAQNSELGFGRRLMRERTSENGGIIDDIVEFQNLSLDSKDFLLAMPLFPLFRQAPLHTFSHYMLKSEQAAWQEEIYYLFGGKRLSGLSSIFVPQSGKLALIRENSSRYDNIKDDLRLNSALNWSSIDLFGSFGSKPITEIFSHDEYAQSLSLDLPLWGEEIDSSWQLNLRQSAQFIKRGRGSFYIGNIFSINDTGLRNAFEANLLRENSKNPMYVLWQYLLSKFPIILSSQYTNRLISEHTRGTSIEKLGYTIEYREALQWSLYLQHDDRATSGNLASLSLSEMLEIAKKEDNESYLLTLSINLSLTLRF